MSNPAAIYARLSTDDTKQTSIPRQIEACKAAAAEQGYAVDDRVFVDDGYSGYLLERPGLDGLLKLARAHMIEAVFVSDADRLSRDYAHDAILRRELLDFHVKLYVGGRPVDTSLEGEMHQGMMAVFASYEGRKIQERMQRGKRWKASQGKAMGGSCRWDIAMSLPPVTGKATSKWSEKRPPWCQESLACVRVGLGCSRSRSNSAMSVCRPRPTVMVSRDERHAPMGSGVSRQLRESSRTRHTTQARCRGIIISGSSPIIIRGAARRT
jgi:DNA invertase Pin-like site-specific DNA recombinase